MNEVLLFFILKYKGDWVKIYQALESREKISIEDLLLIKTKIKSEFVSIINEQYPDSLKKIYKPPFGLFHLGNSQMLDYQMTTLVGDFNYSEIAPIFHQKHAFVMELSEYSINQVEQLANAGVNLILITNIGIELVIKNYKILTKLENVLIISEFYKKPNKKISLQPIQRLSLGLSTEGIINYNKNISNFDLILEIARQEKFNLYNFRNCPARLSKKYNIKNLEENQIYINCKN